MGCNDKYLCCDRHVCKCKHGMHDNKEIIQ